MSSVAHEALVIFAVGGQKWALPAVAVDRVARTVEITPCPGAPASVRGLINVQGKIVPVFDLSSRLGLAGGELDLESHLIVAHTPTRQIALVADEVCEVLTPHASALMEGDSLPVEAAAVDGLLKLDGEIILIRDLDRLLSNEDDLQLTRALAGL